MNEKKTNKPKPSKPLTCHKTITKKITLTNIAKQNILGNDEIYKRNIKRKIYLPYTICKCQSTVRYADQKKY